MLGDEEPDAAAVQWASTLEARDEDFQATVVATAEVYVIYTTRLNGYDLFSVLDAVSADVADYRQLLDEEDGGVEPDGPLADINGLIIANRVSVDPRWRGHSLGPLLLAETLMDLGVGCELAACVPAPFELERGIKTTPEGPVVVDPDAAVEWERRRDQLRVLWSRLGFGRFGATDIFTLDHLDQRLEDVAFELRGRVAGTSRA